MAILIAVLAALGGLTIWLAVRRRPWALSAAAVAAALAAVALIHVAASQPVKDAPEPPFVLWASSGPYSWISTERADAPRTYVWVPPAAMSRELRKGQPLMVERKGKKGKPART